MNDLEKLPKWAQTEISRLNRDLEFAKKQLAALDEKDGKISWTIYPNEHEIPSEANVRFKLDSGTIEARIEDGGIRISAYGARTGLRVAPVVSNVIFVTVGE